MIRIGICDDNEGCRKILRKECEALDCGKGISVCISEYCSQNEVREDLKSLDILLLDIELGEESGFGIRDYIEENKLDVIIIFVSGHSDYVYESFGMNVIGFVKKDNPYPALSKLLNKAVELLGRNEIFFDDISSSGICYIISSGVYVTFILESGTEWLYRDRMHNIEKILSEHDFCRIHRCCIVNLKYVKKVINKAAHEKYVTVGSKNLRISDNYYKAFKEKYSDYCRKKAVYC